MEDLDSLQHHNGSPIPDHELTAAVESAYGMLLASPDKLISASPFTTSTPSFLREKEGSSKARALEQASTPDGLDLVDSHIPSDLDGETSAMKLSPPALTGQELGIMRGGGGVVNW